MVREAFGMRSPAAAGSASLRSTIDGVYSFAEETFHATTLLRAGNRHRSIGWRELRPVGPYGGTL